MKPEDIIFIIEKFADPRFSADWDISGLHIRGEEKNINKLALTLDPSEKTVKSALLWGADFILTHHPTTLSPRLPNKDDLFTKIVQMVIKKGAWLYCAHTSLDVNLKGPVNWLAKALDLINIAPIEPVSEENDYLGYGLIGDLRGKEISILDFFNKLSSLLKINRFITVGKEPRFVKRVAYCPGSGMSLAEKAFSLGSQVFISGDLKYHVAQSLEDLGLTIDVGHFILEEKMIERWSMILREEFEKQHINIEIKFFKGIDPISIKEV